MNPNNLFLACGAMRFTQGENIVFGFIILLILILWLVSAMALYANFCFLLNPVLSKTFKDIHRSILAVCVLPVLSLFLRMWIDDLWTACIVGFGIPLLSISHFVYLSSVKRRLRRKHQPGH